MKKEIGFTLIELMVTIILIALFAAFALPAMNNFVEQQRVNGALISYTNALTFARNEAIRQNVPVVVCGAQISSAGQLVGCAPDATSWAEGVFVYGDVNRNHDYKVAENDINIRVAQSPNQSGEPERVIVGSSARTANGTVLSTNPVFQFLPNGQVVRFDGGGNEFIADMYLRLEIASADNGDKTAVALMDPTGQIIRCTKKVTENNTNNTIANFCNE